MAPASLPTATPHHTTTHHHQVLWEYGHFPRIIIIDGAPSTLNPKAMAPCKGRLFDATGPLKPAKQPYEKMLLTECTYTLIHMSAGRFSRGAIVVGSHTPVEMMQVCHGVCA
jgi:hypothetical protein